MVASPQALAAATAMNIAAKKNDDKRDKGLPLQVPGVVRYDDISYGPAGKWNLLDIYLPEEYAPQKSDSQHQEAAPVIVSIHGGGWVYGTKETYQFYLMSLAQMGFACINFNYRLPPHSHFPQEMDDVDRVFHWLDHHAGDYNLDLSRLFLVGDSAGGQMVDQYLTILTNPQFRALFGYELPKLTVKAAAVNCGASFLTMPGIISGAIEAYFTKDSLQDRQDMIATEKYMTADLPPLFIQTANDDFIRDCSVRLDGYLSGIGAGHEFHSYGDSKNPQGHVFHCDVRNPVALQCNKDEIAFFNRFR